MISPKGYMRLFLVSVIAAIVGACASMGRPEGGPVDEVPPSFVKSNPAPGAIKVSRDRVTLEFDENVKLDDPSNKIVISPSQEIAPKISAVGKKITVNFIDTLRANTTYTLDFTDAIRDLNEGNTLDGFAMAFSTGDVVDSLCISGMVVEASTLEPAQGMLVGVHTSLNDTTLSKKAFERLTKTNQLGQFTIRNLAEGSYYLFAINDKNRDNRWDRTEDIAFYGEPVTPSATRETVTDTLIDVQGGDSLVSREMTIFRPNDILLCWFNEDYKAQYITKYERTDRRVINLQMATKSDSLPEIRFVGSERDGQLFTDYAVLNATPTLDTLQYWIREQDIIDSDSLLLSVRHMRTDTLEQLSWTTDTLKFHIRAKKQKKDVKKEKEEEKKQKPVPADSVGIASDSTVITPDSVPAPEPVQLLNVKVSTSGTIDVFRNIRIDTQEPIARFDPSAVHLDIKVDTLWEEIDAPLLSMTDSLRPMVLQADYKWKPGESYRIRIDSLGIENIYGIHSGPVKSEFTIKNLEEYSNLTFNVTNLSGKAIVELLSSSDKPVKTVPVIDGKAVIRYINPGTYYARLYIDRDSSGTYTRGSVTDSLQPEDTYYFPKKLPLKKNWDVEQSWNLDETPVDMQKPLDIKKNKPKNKNGQSNNNSDEDDDSYYDEFGNPSVDPDDPFGKRKNNNYNRNNRNNS
ncbi:MAG: Ig-like domain-containing protein, partial [Paramuribaculum sp.]|nr:Ig-like domain-containing protein [Paramuribaculum sp.]